jgi:predicted metal-binding protein
VALDWVAIARQTGFTAGGCFDAGKLVFSPAVREMCATDRCHKYGTSWSCPPACGTLDALREKAARYSKGLLVQTTVATADEFDWDTIRTTEARHKKTFDALVRRARYEQPDCFPMGCGACTRCHRCTYPTKPCRYPGKLYPSMEACGLLVGDVCALADVPYYHGAHTMTYTSCILFT